MDEARTAKRRAFLSTELDDPRRIQLRQGRFLEEFRCRGQGDDIVEISHHLTNLRRADDSDAAEAFAVFQRQEMYAVEYAQELEYPLQHRIPLPEPIIPSCPFSDLIRGRRSVRNFQRRPLTMQQLSALMFCALGETGRITTAFEGEQPVEASLRSIPSGGALHPTRIFVVLLQEGDLAPGIYHYDAPEHSLELAKPLFGKEIEALFTAFPIHPDVIDLAQASGIFFITTKFWRARAKYGPRGYRYCLQEAGAACQNLSLAAVALGLAHTVLGGFYDDEVHAHLQLDGVDHAVITSVAVGAPDAQQERGLRNADF